MKNTYVIILLTGLLIILLSSISEMPSLGGVENPSYNEVSAYYIDNALPDTNVANIISSIITDYRAFDTLGETTVLFTSIVAVVSLLSGKFDKQEGKEPKNNG
jgi:multicomponent Na+:H+ antiporter subunit B